MFPLVIQNKSTTFATKISWKNGRNDVKTGWKSGKNNPNLGWKSGNIVQEY